MQSRKAKALKTAAASNDLPLCVDLDGTLVKTDTLLESLILLLKRKPQYAPLLPFWLLQGKANFKQKIAKRVMLDVAALPYNSALLAYLIEQHKSGRKIILATAAEASVAHRVANHLGIFSQVFASSGTVNLSGIRKLERIRDHLGPDGFIYVGNAKVDLPIWRSSRGAIVVNASAWLVRQVGKIADVTHVFTEEKTPLRAFITAIRAYQWVKNGLIFLPLIAGHQLTNGPRLVEALIAFAAFSLCSSSSYLLNDLLDLESDRRHPFKKVRPFASGELPLKVGLFTFPFLAIAGIALSLMLPIGFTISLITYYVLTLGYSFYLKRFVILDVIVLALLYTLRVIAGGLATGIRASNWLLVFSMFLFLSLALLKRYSELHDAVTQVRKVDISRGYSTADVDQLASMGSASGFMMALVLGLYINSEDVKVLYTHPEILWLICPLILYWISRAWIIARRGKMNHDPVVFAIKDKVSYVVGLLTTIILFFAI